MLTNTIKISLSLLLLGCLFAMPYGYYQFVRFAALIAFSYLVYTHQSNKSLALIYVVLAILFQPFLKIHLGRILWNIIDVLVGIGLILSIIIHKSNKNENTI